MFNYQEYWQWKFRYVIMALGALCCLSIFCFFPQPLIKKSTLIIVAGFSAGIGFTVLGALLEILQCLKEGKALVKDDFPTTRIYENASACIYFRGKSMIVFIFALLLFSWPIIFEASATFFGLAIGSFFTFTGIGEFIHAIICDRASRKLNRPL